MSLEADNRETHIHYFQVPPQHLVWATGTARMLRRQAPQADLECLLLCSFSSLLHHCIFCASQTSIIPRYLAYSKSSSQTYLPHCHFNKPIFHTVTSINLTPELALLPSSSGQHKSYLSSTNIPSTLFCHACAEGWASNINPSSCWCFHSLFPSCYLLLVSGWAHSVQCYFCLYVVVHWGTPCCTILWKPKIIMGS